MKHITIEARTLPEIWYMACRRILEEGEDFNISTELSSEKFDSKTKKLAVTLIITNPDEEPIIDERCGANLRNVYNYMEYLALAKKTNLEDYTYGDRLRKGYIGTGIYVDQIDYVIQRFKRYSHDRQCTMVIRLPDDILPAVKHPPCLTMIDCEIDSENKLWFYGYFRSWDAFAGLPVNLAGLELLKQYMAQEIGCENGGQIWGCKNLHLYERYWKIVEDFGKIKRRDKE